LDDELKELRIAADIIDSVDPELSEDEQARAAYRARCADPVAALAIALGILAGFVEQIHKLDPTVLAQLRANAANLEWPHYPGD
jgi:hypothetical protein